MLPSTTFITVPKNSPKLADDLQSFFSGFQRAPYSTVRFYGNEFIFPEYSTQPGKHRNIYSSEYFLMNIFIYFRPKDMSIDHSLIDFV